MQDNLQSELLLSTNTDNDNTKSSIINGYGSLSLAYIGDAVFEIFARTKVVRENNSNVNKMNSLTKEYVKAVNQAKMFHMAMEIATEEEVAVLKRGRNAKANHNAKNASVGEYKQATGLEALFGYLYLTGQIQRLEVFFEYVCGYKEKDKK
ncbi:MAG: Mini-ribonuclease 3 [Lachnospirales bacterium]